MRDEDVEVGGKESPDGNTVVKIIVASGAEVDEVFEGIEIGHVDEIPTLEFVELEGEVSWRFYTAKEGGTHEGEVRLSNNTRDMSTVETTEPTFTVCRLNDTGECRGIDGSRCLLFSVAVFGTVFC